MAVKNERTILVLNRYSLKKDYAPMGLHRGDVVLHIRNDEGVEYMTTLRRNKAHSCSCPSRKPCYHIMVMVAAQNTRYAATKAAKVDAMAAQVVKATPVAIEPAYVMSDAVRKALAATAKPAEVVAEVSEAQSKAEWDKEHASVLSAPLTSNKAFSVLR